MNTELITNDATANNVTANDGVKLSDCELAKLDFMLANVITLGKTIAEKIVNYATFEIAPNLWYFSRNTANCLLMAYIAQEAINSEEKAMLLFEGHKTADGLIVRQNKGAMNALYYFCDFNLSKSWLSEITEIKTILIDYYNNIFVEKGLNAHTFGGNVIIEKKQNDVRFTEKITHELIKLVNNSYLTDFDQYDAGKGRTRKVLSDIGVKPRVLQAKKDSIPKGAKNAAVVDFDPFA